MDRTQTYEKIYFNDNYKEQFEALRNQYHARTQEALRGRKIDHDPVPNATTIVYLHDNGDGNVYVTTGDFVEYFNRRFGDSDRIGAMRRSLSGAVRKAEMRSESKKRKTALSETARFEHRSFQPLRSVRSGFSFLRVVLAMVLILSIGILGGTSLLLERTQAEVMALEEEVAMLEATHGTLMTDQYDATTVAQDQGNYPDMSGADSVEIYPAVKGGGTEMASLLNALASLGK